MGFMDKVGEMADKAAQAEAGVDPDDRYMVEIEPGGSDAKELSSVFNLRWRNGWRLAHVYSQSGKNVLVWERRQ